MISNYESEITGTVNNQLFDSEPDDIIKNGLKSDKYGQGLANVDRNIKMTSAGGCFSALYDSKGNFISDASQAVFFRIYKKNENGTMQKVWLESKYNGTWKELFDKYNSIYNEAIGENDIGIPKEKTFGELIDGDYNKDDINVEDVQIDVKMIPEEIYFKGGYFVPGKIHVSVNIVVMIGDNFLACKKNILDADMTPDDVNEYTKLILGEDKTGYYYDGESSPCFFGVSNDWKDYEDFIYFIDYFKKEKMDIFELISRDYSNGGGYQTFSIDNSFMHHLECSVDALDVDQDDDDNEYVLVTVGSSDILTSYDDQFNSIYDGERYNIFRKVWLPIGLATSFIMMIIAAVIAGFRYLKKKSAYDMYCYRMETTNAMAHDLKTPLAAISGYAENLVEQVHVDKREYYAKSILSNVEYMDKMIHDILELSKSEDARQEINAEEIELAEIVDDEINSLSSIISERELSVSVFGNCKLRTDKKMITSLVDNLISNAVRYAKEKTEITIILADKKTVDASFNGNGMMIKNTISSPLQKTVEELKKPYVKGDDSRGSRSGSGVGLTIVENVAKKLKCKVVYDVTDEEFSVKVMF